MTAECHHHLRSLKGLLRLQLIKELLWMDSHHQTQLVILIQLCLSQEIAAVHQGKAITSAVILRGLPVAENHKGILLMAGGTTDAADRMDMMRHGLTFYLTFLTIASRQAQQIHIRPI